MRYLKQYLKNSSFFFFIFAMTNYDIFKSESIKKIAKNSVNLISVIIMDI
jgi:hypothetical protein